MDTKIAAIKSKGKAIPGYLDLCMRHRDAKRDTPTTIYLSLAAQRAIAEWCKDPSRPPPAPAKAEPAPAKELPMGGAGTELKKLLEKIGITPSPTCTCNAHAREMDDRGTWWCEQNMEKIVGWLNDEIRRRKITKIQMARIAIKALVNDPTFPKSMEGLVRRSIANAHDAPNYVFHVSGFGMGDAICGMYAACGLADATGRRVRMHAHNIPFLARASHPLVDVRPHKKIGPDTGANYAKEIAEAVTRKQHYCRMLADAFGLPPFSPAAPIIDRAHGPKKWNRYAVLAPFSAYESRTWDKWRQLAESLTAEGIMPVAVGNASQAKRLAQTFGGTSAVWFYGQDAAFVTDIMLGAEMVIGNDSGIPHLGGLLGVPTFAIHAGSLPHEFLFELAPSVRSVTPARAVPRNDHNPAALHSITVNAVMDAVTGGRGAEMRIARSRSLLGGKLDAILAIVRGCRIAGDFAELGVYRGGGTAAMAITAPDRIVHAFDTFAGMPDLQKPIDGHKGGDFADSAGTLEYLASLPNVRTHVGIFPESAAAVDARFAVVHLDADLYESTLAGLRWFWPRLEPGGTIILDDWEWHKCDGVKIATDEFFVGVPHQRHQRAQSQMIITKV